MLEVSTQDWIYAGSLVFTTLSNLQAANGGTDPVTIQVMANPIDFHLDMPTEFVPQMNLGKALSEFDPTHPISSGLGMGGDLMGSVAKGKGKGRKARKFASAMKTASLAAKMGSQLAKQFGFTRQINGMGANAYVPRFVNTFALTEGTSEAVPLTCYLDSQLTVSPERFGVGNIDELLLTAVSCRESYLTKFSWSVTDTPGTNLFGVEVTPALWTTDVVTGMRAMTPMCFACMPFEFWSGTIIFRFQVVSSSFHKGIVLIKYDPNSQATTDNINLQTLASIDISKDRDITVEVGMSQVVPWLYHRSLITPSTVNPGGATVPAYAGSAAAPYIVNGGATTIPEVVGDLNLNWKERLAFNGVLSVQVFNTLVVPGNSTTTSIDMLVSVNTGDDFRVASPTDLYIRDMTFFPPAEEEFTPQMNTNEPTSPQDGAPESLTIMHHFGGELGDGCCPHQYMGEEVASLRVLLNRKQYYTRLPLVVTGTPSAWVSQNRSDFPPYPGNALTSFQNTVRVDNTTSNMTYLHYITPAYAMRSGGISRTYVCSSSSLNTNQETIRISRREKGATAAVSLSPSATFPPNYSGNASRGRDAGNSGSHVTVAGFNPVVDVNLPYYDNLNGYPAQMTSFDNGNVFTRLHSLQYNLVDTTNPLLIDDYVSAAPDFSLGMFLSAPPVYARVFA
jgi:hypothetical protein